MKQSKGVLITELIVTLFLMISYIWLCLSDEASGGIPTMIIWFVGYITILDKITKFVTWNFDPQNYKI